jgi:uncharacterized membrane protein
MSTNPNQNQQPDPSQPLGGYGGYSGYNPADPADDPYNAGGQQQQQAGSPQSDPNYVYGQGGGQQYTGGQQQQQQYAPGQQQSNTYVPPSSVRGNFSGQSQGQSASATTKSSRRMALISYLGLCFTGIAIFIFGRKNRFVQFHAAQSIIVFTPLVVVYIVLGLLGTLFGHLLLIGGLFTTIFGCLAGIVFTVGFVLWILLMVQAYRGVMFKLPIVGDYAEALVARFSKKSTPTI